MTLRQITNPGARVAALLSGDVGIIDTPPASDLPRLRNSPQVTVETAPGLRLIYLGPDFSHATNPPEVTTKDGKPFEKSPLLDLRVRRALNIAINRQALAERVMQGMAGEERGTQKGKGGGSEVAALHGAIILGSEGPPGRAAQDAHSATL